MEINKDNQNKKRLGRGLGSLFAEAESLPAPQETRESQKQVLASIKPSAAANPTDLESRIWNIAVDKLVPGTYQPRKNFDRAALEELATSIKENGILQPITVRKRQAGGYEIIAGERRWRASQIAGLHEVPAILKNVTDKEALQLALIENVQREDLDPVEEAESYQRLMEEFSLSQQEVSEKVGKERSTVANAIRLLSLPTEIKEMLSEKKISTGHAKALLSLQDKIKQIKLAKAAIEKNLSVRALEKEIKNILTEKNTALDSSGINIDVAAKLAAELADQLQKALGTKVEISYKRGKGSVSIQFYSDEQLTELYEKLKN